MQKPHIKNDRLDWRSQVDADRRCVVAQPSTTSIAADIIHSAPDILRQFIYGYQIQADILILIIYGHQIQLSCCGWKYPARFNKILTTQLFPCLRQLASQRPQLEHFYLTAIIGSY